MPQSNDARGWIMTSISGVACVLGASIICADLVIRLLPGKKNFKIQDSDKFLSASLSLSCGVMLFSAMYSMLPSAKSSLEKGGFSPKAAAWTLIACYLGGVFGIQIVSRVLHHYIPSHVVDCEHTHDEDNSNRDESDVESGSRSHSHSHGHGARPSMRSHRTRSHKPRWLSQDKDADKRPSLGAEQSNQGMPPIRNLTSEETFMTAPSQRPTLQSRLSRTLSKLSSRPKESCDGDGPCYGFSEPCGQECFKIVLPRGAVRSQSHPAHHNQRPGLGRPTESTPLLGEIGEAESQHSSRTQSRARSVNAIAELEPSAIAEDDDHHERSSSPTINDQDTQLNKSTSVSSDAEAGPKPHHHHVPSNAFMAIGLQTSIAIALHKLPEGFITYATNHANPKLGFAVFLALFIHNITEGFAMALPLYLAINSRWKAMFWSALLGGFSQPLGAGVAAVWFKIAGTGNMAPGEGVYGGMFAVTSGIMASVALQLFSESLDLTHNRGLCMAFAFIGMGILGISSALTA